MKKALFSVILLTTFLCYSQQKQFTIDWNGTRVLSTESSTVEVPSFNKSNFSFDHIDGLKYINQWTSNDLVDENSLKIINVTYAIISRSELKDIRLETIPSKLKAEIKNTNSRGKRSVYIEISPIINENGIYKKVKSFALSYKINLGNRNTSSSRLIVNSVLSQGDWYKFYIEETGVFKLTKSFLNNLGISTNSLDPRSVKVYGQGGNMLPLENSVFYPLDLTENPVKVFGGEDSNFNNNDYILFYGEGPTGYNNESNTNINAYTDKAYYFININSGGTSKQVQNYVEPLGAPVANIDTFHDYQFHELDEYNLAKLGRRWFGDRFDFDPDKVFDFDIPNIVISEPIALKVYAAAVSGSTNKHET